MFIIRFQGGLGNQMFQYAFLQAMKASYPGVAVQADLSAYDLARYHHGYELKKIFDIDVEEATHRAIRTLSDYRPIAKWMLPFYKIKNRFLPTRQIIQKKRTYKYDEGKVAYSDEYFSLNREVDLYLEGYWCSDKYFSRVRDKIMQSFSFANTLFAEYEDFIAQVSAENSVAVHVRRGDYVGSIFDVIPKGYYHNAINYIIGKLKNPKFYFFSDDQEYVMECFDFVKNKELVQGNCGEKSYVDMFLMSQCRNQIIANSTFSYWGAYLNRNPNKIVVAPSKYMAPIDWPLMCDDWIVF